MRRAAMWTALLAGTAILLYCMLLFVELARLMAPLGGIPFSWELLRLNAHWVAAFATGLALVAAGLTLLLQDCRRDG